MSEEQAQQLLYQMQVLESYMAELTQRENTLVNVLNDTTSAIESLKAIATKKEHDTLMSVGMGTFVKTKISSDDKIILNVGAGVAIEKTRDNAINFLESRIKEIEVAIQDATSKKEEIASKLEQGKVELNRLVESSRTKQ